MDEEYNLDSTQLDIKRPQEPSFHSRFSRRKNPSNHAGRRPKESNSSEQQALRRLRTQRGLNDSDRTHRTRQPASVEPNELLETNVDQSLTEHSDETGEPIQPSRQDTTTEGRIHRSISPAIKDSSSLVQSPKRDIYRRLNPDRREIRVIEVHSGSVGDPVSATLRVVSIPSSLGIIARRNLEQLTEYIEKGAPANPLLSKSLEILYDVQAFIEHELSRLPDDIITADDRYLADQITGDMRTILEFSPLLKSAKPAIEQLAREMSGPDDLEPMEFLNWVEPLELRYQVWCLLHDTHRPTVNNHDYEAVSYCWDSSSSKSPMVLDGVDCNAPSAAVEVLRRFRRRDSSRVLWVDALCINQDDVEERENQVMMMGDIYRYATGTVVWLGHEDEESESAVRVCQTISKDIADIVDVQWDNDKRHEILTRAEMPSDTEIASLESIFKRPWFSRLWVLQEAINSRELTCHIGDMEFRWLDLQMTVEWLYLIQKSHLIEPSLRPDLKNGLPMHTFAVRRGKKKWFESLQTLAYKSRALDAIDPRDKIFGLLSMTRFVQTTGHLPAGVRPNYRGSVRRCMCNATKTMIQEDGDLSVLCRADVESAILPAVEDESELWPSWSIAWHLPAPTKTPIYGSGMEEAWIDIDWDAPNGIRAHGDRALAVDEISKDDSPDSLFLTGFAVETVGRSVRADQIMDTDDWHEEPVSLLFPTAAREFQMAFGLPSPVGQDSFLMLITAGFPRYKLDDFYVKYDSRTTEMLVQAIMDTGSSRRSFVKGQPGLSITELWFLTMRIMGVTRRRRFFQTSSGRLGLGPGDMREGDVVAVLFGGAWPFILRPEIGHYRMVGPCYLEGIMHGEAIKERESKDMSPELFDIR